MQTYCSCSHVIISPIIVLKLSCTLSMFLLLLLLLLAVLAVMMMMMYNVNFTIKTQQP